MVELKAVSHLDDLNLTQAMNYLKAYNLPVGLLINFGSKSLEFKRIYNTKHPVQTKNLVENKMSELRFIRLKDGRIKKSYNPQIQKKLSELRFIRLKDCRM